MIRYISIPNVSLIAQVVSSWSSFCFMPYHLISSHITYIP